MLYPQRAALIRRLGRVPDNPSLGPPDDYPVRARRPLPALLETDTLTAWWWLAWHTGGNSYRSRRLRSCMAHDRS